jgi:hypothetical protein
MSGSCVSVEGQDALVIAVVAGVGDVGKAGAADGAGGEVADGSVGTGLVPGADPLEVIGECLVHLGLVAVVVAGSR